MPKRGRRASLEDPRYAEGIASYRQGRYSEAIRQLEPVRHGGGLVGQMAEYYQAMARMALGVDALREGRFEDAEDCLSLAARTVGRNPDLSSYLASLYAGQGRHERCAVEMSRAVDADPEAPAALRRLAQAQWRSGRREEARMTLTAAIRRLPNHAELHVQMGLFSAAEDKLDEARKCLARAIDADCTCADAHYYMALSAAAQGELMDAVRSFQRAFELRRWDLVLAYQLAAAAAAAQQQGYHFVLRLPESAVVPEGSEVRQLAEYVASEPDFLEACLDLPQSSIDDELFGMLAGVVQTALADHRGYADLRYYYSRVLERLGRLDEAVEQAEAALRINPRYLHALLQLGRLYARVDRRVEAIDHTSRAISCGADWPDVHCFAGELMILSGMVDGAKRHFQRALELKSDYARAAEAMSSLAA